MEMFSAVIVWFQTNWNIIEPLAVRLAADIAAAWVLLLALAEVIKKFLPQVAAAKTLSAKLTGVFK